MKIVNGNIELDNKDVIKAIVDYCKKTFPQLTYKDINNVIANSEGPIQSLNSPKFSITIHVKSPYNEKKKSRFTLSEKLSIINTLFRKIEKIGKSEDDENFDFF